MAGDDDSLDAAAISPWRSLLRRRARGASLVFGICWVLYALARLTLMEAAQPSWWPFNAALLLGAIGLVVAPGRVAWALAAVGLAGPLFLLGDWLTQSLALLVVAVVGTITGAAGPGPSPAMCAHHRIAIGIYGMAVFHKLNATFFDPAYSCGLHGWNRLVEELPVLGALHVWPGAWAWATVGTELVLAGLVAFAPRVALVGWSLFHAPLTIALAPAFAFAVLPGIVAALDDGLPEEIRRHGRPALAVAAVVAVAYGMAAAEPSVILAAKLAVMGAVAALGVLAAAGRVRFGSRVRRAGAAALGLFVLNGLTPYVGTQFQHTGAMLSNLRIEPECFNHLIVPADWPRLDPYVRIDRASMGSEEHDTIGVFADYEQTLLETLWAPSSLGKIRRNWCTPRTRPIAVEYRYRGQAHTVADLCDESVVLPRENGVLGGDAWFPGWLRFQKNLSRTCPTACVH